jgi:hypothetical protein
MLVLNIDNQCLGGVLSTHLYLKKIKTFAVKDSKSNNFGKKEVDTFLVCVYVVCVCVCVCVLEGERERERMGFELSRVKSRHSTT